MEPMECDPDYRSFNNVAQNQHAPDENALLENNVRLDSINRIERIISQQFVDELEEKEKEVFETQHRLTKVRTMLDRLRACAVASYYAKSFTTPMADNKTPLSGTSNHPAIKNVMRTAVTSVLSKNSSYSQNTNQQAEVLGTDSPHAVNKIETPFKDSIMVSDDTPATIKQYITPVIHGPRHRIKKTVIVGNISKYIPPEKREGADKSTHKWMVYVRGSKEEPRIDHFVKKVWFFLHPSYRPNDLVQVHDSPFHLTRRGWGEFPIRVQLHFCDPRNKPIDILHNLKLDRTYTGLQTLGMETVCEIELDESSFEPPVDLLAKSENNVEVGNKESIENEEVPKVEKMKESCKLDFNDLSESKENMKIDESNNQQPVDSKKEKQKTDLVNGDVKTNGVDNDIDVLPTKPASTITRKRRKTVECIIPIKRCNLEEYRNGFLNINENVQSKAGDEIKINKKQISLKETENVSECKSKSDLLVNNSATISLNPLILNKPADQFHKLSLCEKQNGNLMNVHPKLTKISPPKEKHQLELLPKLTTPGKCSTKCEKALVNVLPDSMKLNGIQNNQQKVVLLSSNQTTFVAHKTTFQNSLKTPVRILPSNKNIVINVKNMNANTSEKRRSLSVDGGSVPATGYLATTALLTPDKHSVVKQVIKKEPVHVIVNTNIDNSQKLQIPCRLKQTSQGFIVITDPKEKISSRVPVTKNIIGGEAHPISVQNLQTLLNGGKSIKNITFHKSNNEQNTTQPLQKCVFAKLSNVQSKQQVLLVNKQPNDFQSIASCKVNGEQHCKNNQQNGITKRTKLKETPVTPPPTPVHELIGDQIHYKHLCNYADALWVVVPRVPLISPTNNIFNFPCARNKEEFLSWNIGKRRSAEVQRATLVQKILRYIQSKSVLLKCQELPSKRYITKWCLIHGFSVLSDGSSMCDVLSVSDNDESIVDKIIEQCSEPNQLISTLTNPTTFKRIKSESEDEIDVITVSPTKQIGSCGNDEIEYCNQEDVPPSCREHLSATANFVEQIGVKLNELSQDVGIPLTKIMLAKALQIFIKHVKSEAHAEAITSGSSAGGYPHGSPIIAVKDVAMALQSIPEFDFFTDEYLTIKYK